MSLPKVVALDAMGGDFAPLMPLRGALRAARNNVAIQLYGPRDALCEQLNELDANWQQYPITLHDAPDTISMEEHPARAVMSKTNSSLVQAVMSLKDGAAAAVVSAGNSGALMVAALLKLGCVPGTERPAIAGFLPTKHGSVLCLDLGANADCKPQYLLEFATLGVAHLQQVCGIERPRVGLLSNGAEPLKGSLLVKAAYELLASSDLHFIGNVEPAALIEHTADVVVCDGFSGNILLKSFEAAASLFGSATANQAAHAVFEAQGGALLLGVKGTVVVAHGCADDVAIEKAIRLAVHSIV